MNDVIPFINWTVSFGNIIEIIGMAVIVITMFNKQNASISLMRKDINYIQDSQRALNEAFKQLGNILTQVAVQDTRLSMIEKRVDELAHGEGLIGKKA